MSGYRWLAKRMKALGHPVRLQILEMLEVDGESCVCHLESRLELRQAYISQQLARLRDAGLVTDRRDGLNVFYSLSDDSVASLLEEGWRGKRRRRPLAKRTAQLDCPCPRCANKLARSTPSSPAEVSQEGRQ